MCCSGCLCFRCTFCCLLLSFSASVLMLLSSLYVCVCVLISVPFSSTEGSMRPPLLLQRKSSNAWGASVHYVMSRKASGFWIVQTANTFVRPIFSFHLSILLLVKLALRNLWKFLNYALMRQKLPS